MELILKYHLVKFIIFTINNNSELNSVILNKLHKITTTLQRLRNPATRSAAILDLMIEQIPFYSSPIEAPMANAIPVSVIRAPSMISRAPALPQTWADIMIKETQKYFQNCVAIFSDPRIANEINTIFSEIAALGDNINPDLLRNLLNNFWMDIFNSDVAERVEASIMLNLEEVMRQFLASLRMLEPGAIVDTSQIPFVMQYFRSTMENALINIVIHL